jgi:hypothetical protein
MADFDLQGFSSTAWARTLATTLADYTREEEMAWMKNFQLGALLESNGRITYNHAGAGLVWQVRYKKHVLEGNTGETPRNFSRVNLWKNAALPYRGYQATDSISEKELMENRGESAIIKLSDGLVRRLEDSVKQGIATEFYVDGNATGNEEMWHGFESMFGFTQTVDSTQAGATARTANAADFVAYPSDTYAELSTILGNYSGDGDPALAWPAGVNSPEFDFWSPLIVNYTCSGFGGTADTWEAQGDEAMRFGIIHGQRNTNSNGQMTNILLDRTLYFQMLNLLDSKERIIVSSDNELRALGFKNTFVFDGVTVSWETGIPAAGTGVSGAPGTLIGYGLNYQDIEVRCMYDTMFKSEGPHYDEFTQRYNVAIKTLSNLKFGSPRNFTKFCDAVA